LPNSHGVLTGALELEGVVEDVSLARGPEVVLLGAELDGEASIGILLRSGDGSLSIRGTLTLVERLADGGTAQDPLGCSSGVVLGSLV
jgi:hypothetical protein